MARAIIPRYAHRLLACAGKDGGQRKGRKRPGQAERKLEDRLLPLSNAHAPVVEMGGF
jgi:hypothetical protein